MKHITLFLIVLSVYSGLYSQEKSTKNLYSKVVESQIDFERQDNKYLFMNIIFIDERFNALKLSYEGVMLSNLDRKQLKSKSRKGIDIIEIYPIKLSDGQIVVETLSIFKKNKRITIYGKSTYFFKYDCEKGEYILVDKNQKMI